MRSNTKVFQAIMLACASSYSAFTHLPSFAQEAVETEEIERILVTGSRITRVDMETASSSDSDF